MVRELLSYLTFKPLSAPTYTLDTVNKSKSTLATRMWILLSKKARSLFLQTVLRFSKILFKKG